jgi:hypothetical protein
VLPDVPYKEVMTETRITNQHGVSPAPADRVTNNKRRIRRGTGWLAVLLVVPFSAAACGSGATPNVANLGSTATTTTSSATTGTSLDKFSACMRSHGVPHFPDPINNGTTLHVQVGPGAAVDPSSPQYHNALSACNNLAPGFGGPQAQPITPADQLDYLKAATCVRAHGFADFPDPTITDGHVKFVMPPGMNTNSPRIQTAITICRKLIPAGLPYGN